MSALRFTLRRNAEGGFYVAVDVDRAEPLSEDEALALMPKLRAVPDLMEAGWSALDSLMPPYQGQVITLQLLRAALSKAGGKP
jgi:hypothetical protein